MEVYRREGSARTLLAAPTSHVPAAAARASTRPTRATVTVSTALRASRSTPAYCPPRRAHSRVLARVQLRPYRIRNLPTLWPLRAIHTDTHGVAVLRCAHMGHSAIPWAANDGGETRGYLYSQCFTALFSFFLQKSEAVLHGNQLTVTIPLPTVYQRTT